jgi:hypothetical protein
VNDPFEREADAVAERVMRSTGQPIADSAAGGASARIQRACQNCGTTSDEDALEEGGIIRRKATDTAGHEPNSQTLTAESLTRGGSPLPGPVRGYFEPRFGQDFAQVRVHTGAESERANAGLRANAFTYGNHIWLGRGEGVDRTPLLAHELTHVVQQNGSTPAGGRHLGGGLSGSNAERSIQRDPQTDGKKSDKSGSECTTDAMPGAAKAYPENKSRGPSGTYVIWGPKYAGQSVTDYSRLSMDAWIVWRFGTVSGASKNQLEADISGSSWIWLPEGHGHPPAKGCQATTSISIARMNRLVAMVERDKAARGEARKEAKAGLPALPDPEPIVGDMTVVAANSDPSKPDVVKRITEREQAEEALDPTSVYNKGEEGANFPPFPAHMEGPETEVPSGTGTFSMVLHYERVTGDPFRQMALYMNAVSYHWEIFDITAIVERGLKMGSSMLEEAKRTNELSRNLETNSRAAAAAQGATSQRAANAVDELKDETKQALRELRHPVKAVAGGSAIDVVTRAWANVLNLQLIDASALNLLGGILVKSFPDLLGDFTKEKEIAFPLKEGFYMVRCIAQPSPRGPNQSEIRAASVSSKIVEVRSPEILGANALGMAGAAIAYRELQKVMTSDPAEIARLDREIADLRSASSGDIVSYLERLVKEKKDEKEKAAGWRQAELQRELEELELRLNQAKEKRTGTSGTHTRLQVAFTSKETGQTYPLVIEVSEIPDKEKDRVWVRLFDVTVKDRKPIDTSGKDLPQAVRNALTLLSHDGDLGPGWLFIRLPEGYGEPREYSLPVVASGGAVTKRRLEDLATVLLMLSIVVPGVGEISMVIAAALAVERLISRALNNSLRLDADSVSDTLAILGAVAQGAQLIGQLRVARSGKAFVAAMRSTEQGALEAAAKALTSAKTAAEIANATANVLNVGGLIWGDLALVNRLGQIAELEMQGKISHADAARQRAEILAGAIQGHGIMLAGALRPHGADKVSGVETKETPPAKTEAPPDARPTKPGEGPTKPVEAPAKPADSQASPAEKPGRPETIPEDELETRANEPAASRTGSPPATDKKKGVRARFTTPDQLHQIFILEDGRIFRCSLSCSELRSWYEPYLANQPEGSRRQRAADLEGQLRKLEERVKGGAQSQALEQAIGALDQAMREFIAPDFGLQLQRAAEARNLVKPGETFVTGDQIRGLLKFYNLDELVRLTGPEGLPSAKAVRHLADLLTRLEGDLSAKDRARIHSTMAKQFIERWAKTHNPSEGSFQDLKAAIKGWSPELQSAFAEAETGRGHLEAQRKERAELIAERITLRKLQEDPQTKSKENAERLHEISDKLAENERQTAQLTEAQPGLDQQVTALSKPIYDRLRDTKIPDAKRNQVFFGSEKAPPGAKKVDKVGALKTAPGEVTIDHIVSVKEFSGMDGVEKLTPDERLEILNQLDNLIAMDASANSARQETKWSQWKEWQRFYSDPLTQERMAKREAEIRGKIQQQIKNKIAGR